MPTVLAFVTYYLPGFKAGGPLRTLANMVDRMSDEFSFKIVTLDRDQGDPKTYPGVRPDAWNEVSGARVFYLSPSRVTLRSLRRLIESTPHDVLYLNSCFDLGFSIRPLLLRRLGLLSDRPVVVAPRGEFSAGALTLKRHKKRAFIRAARWFGLYRRVLWQASTIHEESDIRREFGDRVSIGVAKDLAASGVADPMQSRRREKTAGSLRVLFLSRVTPKKNVALALEMLDGLRGSVEFNIHGAVDDEAYWRACREKARTLPGNVKVEYGGSIPHDQVFEVMREHDLFFLPTLGENYGHVIQEALLAGCPVLISDQTPWRGLEARGAGWDLSLDDPEGFRRVLQQCVDMDGPTHRKWSRRALEYGRATSKDDEAVEQNRELFRRALK